MNKNFFCKNTKLSEKEFLEVLYSYFLFDSATTAALKVGKSRQSVLALFKKIGSRIGDILQADDFPNFSTRLACQILGDEPEIMKSLNEYIRPQRLKLVVKYRFENRLTRNNADLRNAIVIERLQNKEISVIIYDGDRNSIYRDMVPVRHTQYFRNLFRQQHYKNLNSECHLANEVLDIMCIKVRQKIDVRVSLPEIDQEDYLEYRENNVSLDKNNSVYRMLESMRLTDKNLRGFTDASFNSYMNRARLIELMFIMYENKNDKSFTEKMFLAQKSAYCFTMLALRMNAL